MSLAAPLSTALPLPATGLAFAPVSGLTETMIAQPPATQHLPLRQVTETAAHAALLQRVGAERDRAAFVTLFHFYAPRVKSYLMKSGADETTAEEIVQSTFITVWEKAAGYNPKKAAVSTWIFTIARNKRIDALRRQKFVAPLKEDDDSLRGLTVEPQDDYADPATVEQLHAAIDTLPAEQARLLRLSFFDDLSHQAIADETDLPLGTVKSRLRLAMDKLRQIMGTGGQA